nr:immunoglobulin heavy chain junction region [Macaca mulatta]
CARDHFTALSFFWYFDLW